ncbi:MAG: hypothetical protein FWB98_03615 [Defluviitaleaceae bacterium]|nr:hypothetical protein [Defluviitaleaceae bacterium]
MKILRAGFDDLDIFREDELNFGGCCFYSEDRAFRFYFEIDGQEATLHANTDQYLKKATDNFLFYSGFVNVVRDDKGNKIAAGDVGQLQMLEISQIQPSQFFVSQKKLEGCRKWITRPEDVKIPVVEWKGKRVSLDGHTRLRVALDMGFTHVYTYPEEYDGYTFQFAEEAEKHGILTISHVEVIGDEEYKIKWNKYCKDFFANKVY